MIRTGACPSPKSVKAVHPHMSVVQTASHDPFVVQKISSTGSHTAPKTKLSIKSASEVHLKYLKYIKVSSIW